MLNKGYDEFIRQHEEAWTLSYLFPEKYGGAKIPDPHPAPSNSMTITMDRTTKSFEGKYLGVFSPIIETCAPYFNSYEVNTDLPTGSLSEYIVYADNSGSSLNIDEGNILTSLSTWNYKQGPSYHKLSAYKKLRVVGACLELIVVDIEKNYSGIIETCLGFEVIGNSLKNDNIDLDKLSNYPSYKTFKTNEEVILKYRYNNEKYTTYGPYEPFSCVPLHIIKISGLSSTASIKIRTTIHIEGLLMPTLVHFATKDIIPQKPKQVQLETLKTVPASVATTKEKNEEYHQTHMGNIPPYKKGTVIDDGFPRESSKVKISTKIRVDDLLRKRQDPKIKIDDMTEYVPYQEKSSLSIFGDIMSKMTAKEVYDAIIAPKKKNNEAQIFETNKTMSIMPDKSTFRNNKENNNVLLALPANEIKTKKSLIYDDSDIKESMISDLGIYNKVRTDKKEPDPLSIQYLNAFINKNPGALTDEDIEIYKHFEPSQLLDMKRAYDLGKNNTKDQIRKENTATFNKYEMVIDEVGDDL